MTSRRSRSPTASMNGPGATSDVDEDPLRLGVVEGPGVMTDLELFDRRLAPAAERVAQQTTSPGSPRYEAPWNWSKPLPGCRPPAGGRGAHSREQDPPIVVAAGVSALPGRHQ